MQQEARTITEEAILSATEFSNKMALYEAAAEMVHTRLLNFSGYYKLTGLRDPIDSIQWRLKSPLSILGKMARLNEPFTLDNMERVLKDIAGVRVICHFISDVYAVVDLLDRQEDIEIVTVKDYIRNPKENGYRSVHLITMVDLQLVGGIYRVPVEIQLRTIAMNCWASCEHQLRYKKAHALPEDAMRKLKQVADTMSEMDLLVQSIADEVFGDEKVEKTQVSAENKEE